MIVKKCGAIGNHPRYNAVLALQLEWQDVVTHGASIRTLLMSGEMDVFPVGLPKVSILAFNGPGVTTDMGSEGPAQHRWSRRESTHHPSQRPGAGNYAPADWPACRKTDLLPCSSLTLLI
jgi:hypothetical protein